MRPTYDVVSGQFLGLVEMLGYLTVRGDERECFFDYSYSKENSNILYSTHKMKILNSFSATIFSCQRIQHEPGALSDTDFSKPYLVVRGYSTSLGLFRAQIFLKYFSFLLQQQIE